ncbi:1,4-alpha-glucan branching protein GlgB [soil metagenome]
MAEATREQDIVQIAHAQHPNAFSVLGLHRVSLVRGWANVVRAFVPWARELTVIPKDGEPVEMQRVHSEGFFEAILPDGDRFEYRLRGRDSDGNEHEFRDPYTFPTSIGELDLHLMGEGTDLEMYRKLGAHPCSLDGVSGVRFAVWAPNASRVSVVGEFNFWDGRRHQMRKHPSVGVWEIFIPDLAAGAVYKYEIAPQHGSPFLKSDPLAFRAQLRPETASVVHQLDDYDWTDQDWMEGRKGYDVTGRPMTIYEVHPGSWRWSEGRPLSYRELAHQLGDYLTEMGFTHVELLPVMEHPYDPSWGYQVTGYFAPTSRFGSPTDFKYFVDHMHARGIGVILDWVPAHFPKDAAALSRFDGTALYEHQDPRRGEHPDWGTLIFNFGRNEVRNFLISNALFWLREYHVDGLRVDAVASMLYLDYSRNEGEWLANVHGGRENLEAIDFLKQLNRTVREREPGTMMIAEESTAWPGVTQSVEGGGLGFHLKWNMGWMNDFLRFVEQETIYRKYHFALITFSLMYAFSERFVLPISHDEVVHGKRSLLGKMPGDEWQKFANLRLALGFMWVHPGKQLLFMGSEIGQWREWSESRELDWELLERPLHSGVQRWVRDLNHLYREHAELWELDATHQGFEWIDFHDVENTVLAFRRKSAGTGEEIVVVCNFTPIPREGYRFGIPAEGVYRELLNSDAGYYGGSNMGNGGALHSEAVKSHNLPHSLCLRVPPLGILILKREA